MNSKHVGAAFRTRTVEAGRAAVAGRARDAVRGLHTKNAEMVELSTTGRRGTRKRALVPVLAGFLAVGSMFSLVSSNVMAVNFTTGNNEFKIYSNYLDAEKAAGFLSPTQQQDGSQDGTAELGIVTAKLAGLCAIATEGLPILGNVSLKITAGDAIPDSYTGTAVPAGVTTAANGKLNGSSLTSAIAANNLYMNSNMLQGYGNLVSGLNLGQSANTVGAQAGITWPTGAGGTTPTAGNFGLYADQLNVAGLSGESYGLNLAGAITLPNLKITVEPGAKAQPDCS